MVLLTILGGAAALLIAVAAVFRWASGDAGVEREVAKGRFQAEQNWRDLRRADKS